MPTIFILFGFRFQFFSNEHEPLHIHVTKGGAAAKFNVSPLSLVKNAGFKPSELKLIESLLEENSELIIENWNKYFNKDK